MGKRYRVTATSQVGGRFYVQGDVVSEEEAKKGHPSLIDVGVAVALEEMASREQTEENTPARE